VYGGIGYFEFVGFPDLQPRDQAPGDEAVPEGAAAGAGAGPARGRRDDADAGGQAVLRQPHSRSVGNSTTRDNVIPPRDAAVREPASSTPRPSSSASAASTSWGTSRTSRVPIRSGGEDPRRRQQGGRHAEAGGARTATSSPSAPACPSTRGSSASCRSRPPTSSAAARRSPSRSRRAAGPQLPASPVTEPFLFDRPISGGVDFFSREVRWINQYTEESTGMNLGFGFPAGRLHARVHGLQLRGRPHQGPQPRSHQPRDHRQQPVPGGGAPARARRQAHHQQGHAEPRAQHRGHPMFPTKGRRLTGSVEFAGLGGNTSFYKPRTEYVQYIQQNRRLSVGFRAQVEYVAPLRQQGDRPADLRGASRSAASTACAASTSARSVRAPTWAS